MQTAASDANQASSLNAIKQYVGSGKSQTCFVQDGVGLTDAVENQLCSMVFLVNGASGAYQISKEILVKRRVLIQGHPAILPEIDPANGGAERGFHVVVSDAD